jgi:IS5 family transposase
LTSGEQVPDARQVPDETVTSQLPGTHIEPALKKVAKEVGLDLRGAYLNLDGGFDSAHNRKCLFNAGLIPNIPENPRNRKHPKRGRKRLFNAAIHALRMRVERTFAWEDKFKRLLLRFERIQQRHYGMKLMAYTLINIRAFCGV